MTINEAHNYFKLELDKTSSLELPAFEQEEIDYWLDDAITSYIKSKYFGATVKGESFEQSQSVSEDLRLLLVEGSIGGGNITPGTNYANSVNCDLLSLSPDYFISVREAAVSTYNSSSISSDVIVATHDNINVKLQDPFSEHKEHLGRFKPLRLLVGDDIILIGDGNYTITGLQITYLKKPTKVADVTTRDTEYPDLTDSSMQDIVKLAATRALENIESPRAQSHMAVSQ